MGRQDAWNEMEAKATAITDQKLKKEAERKKLDEERSSRVLAEIKEELDAQAHMFGLGPQEYRSQLSTGVRKIEKTLKPIKPKGKIGSTWREWNIIHQIIKD